MYMACELNKKPIFRSLYSVIRTWVKYNPPWIKPLLTCDHTDFYNSVV